MLKLEELETRLTPAVRIQFDFRFDSTEFFTDHIDRINLLQAAADEITTRFSDELAAIPFPTAGNAWQAKFTNPSASLDEITLTNLLVPEDTIIIFVGARDLGIDDGGLISVSSRREVTGDAEWVNLVRGRGQAGAVGMTITDVSPWGGSIAFDRFENWHFGSDAPGNDLEWDFKTAAQHGIMHLLGFGSNDNDVFDGNGSQAFSALTNDGADLFIGPSAVAQFGAPVPLQEDETHWDTDVRSSTPEAPLTIVTPVMSSQFERGERFPVTILDLAAMQDIGWEVIDGIVPPPPPPPPVSPMPPMIPPTNIPAGFDMFAVGAGEGTGASSHITFNESRTFTQVIEFAPFGASFTGGARVATGDLNNDGVKDIAVGPGPGRATVVQIYDGATFPVQTSGALLRSIPAFEAEFLGGIFVAMGDFTGDGRAEIAFSPDEGGGPRIRIFDGATFVQIADFFGIEDPDFRGGARPAVGDLNGDGRLDLLVAAGFGGGPRVAAFDGSSIGLGRTPTKLFPDFFVFEGSLRNGTFLAGGDLNGDGNDDLIAGGGPGGGPRVLALSGMALTTGAGSAVQLANFFAGDPNSRGGVRLGVNDQDGDNRADLLTGAGTDSAPVVTTYLGRDILPDTTPPVNHQFQIFDSALLGGVFVG